MKKLSLIKLLLGPLLVFMLVLQTTVIQAEEEVVEVQTMEIDEAETTEGSEADEIVEAEKKLVAEAKEKLKQSLDQANGLVENDQELYLSISIQKLKDGMEVAQGAYDSNYEENSDYTNLEAEKQYQDANTLLQNLIVGLEKRGNSEELSLLLKQAISIEKSKLTNLLADNLNNAMVNAQAIVDGKEVSEGHIEAVFSELETAYKAAQEFIERQDAIPPTNPVVPVEDDDRLQDSDIIGDNDILEEVEVLPNTGMSSVGYLLSNSMIVAGLSALVVDKKNKR